MNTATHSRTARVSSRVATWAVVAILGFTFVPVVSAIALLFIAPLQIHRGNKKRRGRRWAALGIAIVITLVFARPIFERQFTYAITGVPFTLGQPEYVYETERSFNGDGYTILAYKLPSYTGGALGVRGLPFGPRKRWFRHEWDVVPWARAPVRSEDSPYVKFGFQSEMIPEAEHVAAMALEALKSNSTFYAYLHKSSVFREGNLWVQNVDFYIIDLDNGRFFVVNHNT